MEGRGKVLYFYFIPMKCGGKFAKHAKIIISERCLGFCCVAS